MARESSPKDHGTNPLAARIAAFDVLRAVLHKNRALDDALAGAPAFSGLGPTERAYAGFVVRTALRRIGQIDALILHCVPDPLPRKARPVVDVLRIGIAQLMFSVTADHAAVGTTVDLCRAVRQEPFAKLVNAVMRRLQREGAVLLTDQDAAQLNTPDWLWQSWCTAYGEPATRAIAAQHLLTPPLDLSCKRDAEGWAETFGGEVVLGGTVRLKDGADVVALPGFAEGEWWVQDAAARLPVTLLGDVAGKTVFDLCAAPGGKTLELAAAGARVTALDISARRLERIRDNLERTRLDATLICADARTWEAPGRADVVLLDAPCSSTGTIRRHPDVAHLKSADDVTKLAQVQDGLLDAAAAMVAPGGTLLYVTCSLQSEEGPERIEAFLTRYRNFTRRGVGVDEVPGIPEAVSADGDLRTLPCHLAALGGMDGFYAARLLEGGA